MEGDVTYPTLFGPPDGDPEPKPVGDAKVTMQVLITVKAAPNPSELHGELVCVAGIRAELEHPGWVRLYPINYRALESGTEFSKYQFVTLSVKPARPDPRRESFRPDLTSIRPGETLSSWKRRRPWLDDYVEDSMCRLNRDAGERADAKSLALIRPRDISDLVIDRHPGWDADQQRRIDAWVNQGDLLDSRPKRPLQAPRFTAKYRYRCGDVACRGHNQGILDWELVTLQRHLAGRTDDEVRAEMRTKFLTQMCGPGHDTAFFVGNQAKRPHVFSVLGVYYPPR
jgi:hypothetical protein